MYSPLVDNEHVGQYGPYSLCLSVTKLFLVPFKYFIVIIKKVEMLYENVI